MTLSLRPLVPADLPLPPESEPGALDDFGPAMRINLPDHNIGGDHGVLGIDVDGVLIGTVSWIAYRFGPNHASRSPMFGIGLYAEHRGRGWGTQAQQQLVDLFFLHTATNRVQAHTDVDNHAEQRALEKVGLQREGITRGAQWRDGAYRDGWLYAMTRADWLARRES